MSPSNVSVAPYVRADIYDELYQGRGKNYLEESRKVSQIALSRKPDASNILDVACGAGAHLVGFSETFSDLHGIDSSTAMVQLARQRIPNAWTSVADMRTFNLNRSFDVISCMFSSVAYLETVADLNQAVKVFARHLTTGGVLIVEGWWTPETFLPGYVRGDSVKSESRVIARVSSATLHPNRNASRISVHYTVAQPFEEIETFQEIHDLTLFTRDEYCDAFSGNGMDVEWVGNGNASPGFYVGVKAADLTDHR